MAGPHSWYSDQGGLGWGSHREIRISARAESYCRDVFQLTMAVHTTASLLLRFSVLCSLLFSLPIDQPTGATTEPVLGIIPKREAKDVVFSWGNNTHTHFYLKTKWSDTK